MQGPKQGAERFGFWRAGFAGFKPNPTKSGAGFVTSSRRPGGDWQNEMLLLHGDENGNEDENIFDCNFQVNIIGNPFAPSTFTVPSSPMERFLDFKRKVASTAGLSGIFTTYILLRFEILFKLYT